MTEPSKPTFDLISWTLDDGEAVHREAPDSFWMPPLEERESLPAGAIVKLMFRMVLRDPGTGQAQEKVERMWVGVTGRDGHGYVGALDNDPFYTKDLAAGDEIRFEPRHVIRIYDESGREKRS